MVLQIAPFNWGWGDLNLLSGAGFRAVVMLTTAP